MLKSVFLKNNPTTAFYILDLCNSDFLARYSSMCSGVYPELISSSLNLFAFL